MASAVDRVLHWTARFGRDRRRFVLLSALALVVVAGILLPGIRVSTSRYGLVSEDNPYQARLLRFYERFGYPDAPILVISGGTADDRRGVVDALSGELQQIESLRGRILGRMEPRVLAEVLFLQDPAGLSTFVRDLPEGMALGSVVEGGLVGWTDALEELLASGLSEPPGTEAKSADSPPASDEARLEQTMAGLKTLALAFEMTLQGGDGFRQLPLAGALEGRPGVDEHGYLVADDGALHVIALYPDLPDDEARALEPLVKRVREIRDDVLANQSPDVRAQLTGVPALAVDELRLLREGLFVSTVAASVGIYLLCLAFFRSFRQATIALIPLGVGVLWTLGIVRVVYGELNLITSSFVAVLLGLGIDFAVHVVSRANEGTRARLPAGEAVVEAVRRAGPGVLAGTVATSLAFLTTVTTEFTAYAQLGVITAVGLVIIMFATFLLLPALMTALDKGGRTPPRIRWFSAVSPAIRRFQWFILGGALIAGVAGGLALRSIQYNPNHFDFLPQSTESAQALTLLEDDPRLSPLFANLSAAGVEEARSMAERLRELDSVSAVQAATDLLPPLDEARLSALRDAFVQGVQPDFDKAKQREIDAGRLAKEVRDVLDALDEIRFTLRQAGRDTTSVEGAMGGFAALYEVLNKADVAVQQRLVALERTLMNVLERAWTTARAVAERGAYAPNDLPPLFAKRFVSKDGSGLAVYAVARGDVWDPVIGESFARDMEAIDPEASGQAMTGVEHNRMIVEGFERAAVYAAILILFVLFLDFRSIADALLALAPTLLGWLWMLGIMATIGLDFDVANIVVLPLVLGIGITFGVHLVHRCREEERTAAGPADLDEVVRGTGGAVIMAALTTMMGFAALMLGEYGAFRTLGAAMVLGIATTLVASVVVLPAVLRALGRAR